MVLHCQEKVLNLMTSKPLTSFKISGIISMMDKSALSSVGFMGNESKRGENVNRGHDPWQFAGHMFCQRTLRGEYRHMT